MGEVFLRPRARGFRAGGVQLGPHRAPLRHRSSKLRRQRGESAAALADFLRGSGGASADLSNLTPEERRSLQRSCGDNNKLNTDYDFYSAGLDRVTEPNVTAWPSADDILRAKNGLFFGTVEELLRQY
ncbi:MAG: hypothetical protein V3W41_05295 [Planctomycetota bacterium]